MELIAVSGDEPRVSVVSLEITQGASSGTSPLVAPATTTQTVVRRPRRTSISFDKPAEQSKLITLRPVFAGMLFAGICMIIGILVVRFTTHRGTDRVCLIGYTTMPEVENNQNSRPRALALGDFNADGEIDVVVTNTDLGSITVFIGHGDGSFSSEPPYNTSAGSLPYSVAVGHFNSDRHLDIAVANYGTHNIVFFFGHGNGSFALEMTYSTGIYRPLTILVHDVNNDNQSDIIVLHDLVDTIGIILGYGNRTFSAQKLYSMGYDSMPYAAVVGDFNNDTRLDIAVATLGTRGVSILLGNEQGLFTQTNPYFLGVNVIPCSIAVTDFNKDNRPDVIVANTESGSLDILLGNGNGTFGNRTTLFTGIYDEQEIAVADVNSDGFEDLLITDTANDGIHIIEGSQDGTSGRRVTRSTGANSGPRAMIVVDLNRDKRKDIVVVNARTNNLAILLGRHLASFGNQTTYTDKLPSPQAIAAGDFNNDSQLDFVVANYNDNSIAVFLATVDGNYTLRRVYELDPLSYPSAVAIADFDNDTRLDFVASLYSAELINIYYGRGDGTFGNRQSYPTGDWSGPQSVLIGDVNNDQRLDIIYVNDRSNNVGVLLNIGSRQFADQITSDGGPYIDPFAVAIGDFNEDHHLDIAFVTGVSDQLVTMIGTGNGTFVDPIIYTFNDKDRPSAIAVADFNNDTYLDIVVANQDTSSIYVFLGFGNGSFPPSKTYLTAARSSPSSIAIGDLNNDQSLDIIIGLKDVDFVDIFLGNGDGTFTEQSTFVTGEGSRPLAVVVADLNNDHRLDLLVTDLDSKSVRVFIGYDDVMISRAYTYSTGSATQPRAIAVVDFNRDGELDMVVTHYGTGAVRLLRGHGNMSFTTEDYYETGADSLPTALIVDDFNSDSVMDIAVCNLGSDQVGLFLATENGTFAAQKTYSVGTGSYPSALAAGDFDSDGYMDLAVSQAGADNIAVLQGYGLPNFEPQKTLIDGSNEHPCSVAVADINDDGLLDIVILNVTVVEIAVYLAIGNGTFSSVIRSTVANGILLRDIAIADFNDDRRLDIVSVDDDGINMGVFLGYGNGSFTTLISYSIPEPAILHWLAVADLNNDNRTDVLVSNAAASKIFIFLATVNGTFGPAVEFFVGNETGPVVFAVADLNRDNNADIVVVHETHQNKKLVVFLGNGPATFDNETIYSMELVSPGQNTNSIVSADFDNDHHIDIALCYSRSDRVAVFLGHGNGSFAAETTYVLETTSYPYQFSMSAADFNNDNRLDIVVTLTFTHKIAVLLGLGDGTFELVQLYSTGDGSLPFSIGVGDLNQDRFSDILVSTAAGKISILSGFSREIFFRPRAYTTGVGSAPQSVAVGDFNNDTRQDIIVGNTGSNTIGLFIGSGDGTFQPQTVYPIAEGSRPQSLATGDFNSDGRLDVVVANGGRGTVGVFLARENGTFGSVILSSTGSESRPSSITVFDVNNDRRLDVAIVDGDAGSIVILIGHGNGSFELRTKYTTGFGSRPCAIAAGDFNNDSEVDLAIANCGTNEIGFITKLC